MKFFWREEHHTKIVKFGSRRAQVMLYNKKSPVICEVTYEEAEESLLKRSEAEHLNYYQYIKNLMNGKGKVVMVDEYSEKRFKK